MSASWQSLYLRCDKTTAVERLRQTLNEAGYQAFDPFGLIPGKSYPLAVRAFAAPTIDGWTRVISENALDESIARAMSAAEGFALAVSLIEADAHFSVYQAGAHAPMPDALTAYLRPDKTPDDLRAAFAAVTVLPAPSQKSGLPLDALPKDVQQMAGQINMQQAQGMFARLSGDLLKKTGGASASISQGVPIPQGIDWNSAGGARIQAVMACLSVPDSWREPDFVTLRDAYQLHLRRERLPNARLYPGDAEAMERVPEALTYTPVYAGKV
jgi:hypothetical protein